MMKRDIAFIHTSPAAIGPLMQFYTEAAPELQITNLLDDGLLRLLAAKNFDLAMRRLADMLEASREAYSAEMAMVTCSSVSKEMVEELSRSLGLSILKIDSPMAQAAVRTGRRIGVAATFPPTLEPTSRLLAAAAEEAGSSIEITPDLMPEAYDALLAGDYEAHDARLLDGIRRLDRQGVDVIVLAQVSMARILPRLSGREGVPILSSLTTSLTAIREVLKAADE